jgi:hypothetical protein
MELRFYHDPDSDLPHIYNHGVSEEEVEDVLRHPLEEGRSTQKSRVTIGQTRAGRYLKVISVPDAAGDGIFVVTAYDLKGKALSALRRRMRRRQR